MLINILLWGIVLIAGLFFLSYVSEFRVRGTLASLFVIWLTMTGINRHEASEICDAINQIGGKASYLSGKCMIQNDGGIPLDKDNDRLVRVNLNQ